MLMQLALRRCALGSRWSTTWSALTAPSSMQLLPLSGQAPGFSRQRQAPMATASTGRSRPAAGRDEQRGGGRSREAHGGWSERPPPRTEREGGSSYGAGPREFGEGGSSTGGGSDDGIAARGGRGDRRRATAGDGSYGGGRGGYGGRGGGGRGQGAQGDRDSGFMYPPRTSKADLRAELFGQVVYGVSPVLIALKQQRRTAHVLYVQESLDPEAAGGGGGAEPDAAGGAKRKVSDAVAQAIQMASAGGAAIKYTNKHEMNMLSDGRPHQGLVLDCSPLEWQPLDMLPSVAEAVQGGKPPPVWLALDEVTDPQNLGAIIRSAYCLGAAGVLACARNCAPLSGTVSKASAGALELVQLHSCKHLPRTLQDAAERGWAVLGATASPQAVPCGQLAIRQPTVLVVGSEGFGLRTNVRRVCTQLVAVDMEQRPSSEVDSLNVSVATGILLHQLLLATKRGAAAAVPAAAAAGAAAAGVGQETAAESSAGAD